MAGIGHNSGGASDQDDENPYGRAGYIKVGRDLRWHHLVGFGKPVTPADDARGFVFSKAEAWQDLIMECRYNAGTVLNKGVPMKIEPGQLLGAISWLANRWNWTPKTVRVFLDALERDGMIERSVPDSPRPDQSALCKDRGNPLATTTSFKGNHVAMVTICNYELYQFIQRVQGQPNFSKSEETGQPRGSLVAAEGHDLNKGNKGTTGIQKHTHRGGVGDDDVADAPSAPRAGASLGSTLAHPASPEELVEVLARATAQALEATRPKRVVKNPKQRTQMREDWQLPRSWGEWALATFYISETEIRQEAERFRNHWLSNAEVKANWFRTWQNWCQADFRKWRRRPDAPVDNVAPDLLAPPVVDEMAQEIALIKAQRAEWAKEDGE